MNRAFGEKTEARKLNFICSEDKNKQTALFIKHCVCFVERRKGISKCCNLGIILLPFCRLLPDFSLHLSMCEFLAYLELCDI